MSWSRATTRRTRWVTLGAVVAATVGAGAVLPASATIGNGERAVFVPITPCRWIDTRPTETVGPRSTPLGPGDTYATAARGAVGNCTIPAGAVGLVLNVAVVQPSGDSFLTVFPGDATRPLAASVNWIGGQPPLSNAVTTDIGGDGRVAFFNLAGTVHLAVDIVGYFEDHHHDDRYYTESEVDSRLATKVDKPTGFERITFDISAFVPTRNIDGTSEQWVHDVEGARLTASTGQCFVTPVDLPDGATVTIVSALLQDTNAGASGRIEMFRRHKNVTNAASVQMASATSVNTQATTSDNTIVDPIIDNVGFVYLLRVCIDLNIALDEATIAFFHPA